MCINTDWHYKIKFHTTSTYFSKWWSYWFKICKYSVGFVEKALRGTQVSREKFHKISYLKESPEPKGKLFK